MCGCAITLWVQNVDSLLASAPSSFLPFYFKLGPLNFLQYIPFAAKCRCPRTTRDRTNTINIPGQHASTQNCEEGEPVQIERCPCPAAIDSCKVIFPIYSRSTIPKITRSNLQPHQSQMLQCPQYTQAEGKSSTTTSWEREGSLHVVREPWHNKKTHRSHHIRLSILVSLVSELRWKAEVSLCWSEPLAHAESPASESKGRWFGNSLGRKCSVQTLGHKRKAPNVE